MDIKDKIDYINKRISTLKDKGEISDGSHTFDELYYHRMILFSIISNSNKNKAWKSKLHDDGTMFDVTELEHAPKWDGHTSKDVDRLLYLIKD